MQAKRIATALVKGIKDGLPIISNIKQAWNDPDTPKLPRLVASLATIAALAVALWKYATGALSFADLVQLIQGLL